MGYIYLLYNDEGKGYIGRTEKTIRKRILGHNAPSNKCCSKLLGKFEYEILEEVDNDYLYDYEQYYYDMYNEMFPNMLINKSRPKQSPSEYYNVNKAIIKKRQSKYQKDNKDKLNEYNRNRYIKSKN
jgi:hypothetical protein